MQREKTAAFYDWQIENGCAEQLAERTNAATVSKLLVGLAPDACLLDLGCGTGRLACRLERRGVPWGRYVGIDLSEKAIQKFRAREVRGTDPKAGDATDLSRLEQNSFDAVICAFLLQDQCEADGKKLLQQIVHVMKPQGRAVVALTVHPEESSDQDEYRPRMLADRESPTKFARLWSKSDFAKLMSQSGFKMQKEKEDKTETGLLEIYSAWYRASQPTV